MTPFGLAVAVVAGAGAILDGIGEILVGIADIMTRGPVRKDVSSRVAKRVRKWKGNPER